MDFLEDKCKSGDVYHEAINTMLGKRTYIPHEWYFINVLINKILKNNALADAFVMYVVQYYPDYPWLSFKNDDYLATAIVECGFHRFQFQKKYEFDFEEKNSNILSCSMIMGDIATDFLIRYCGYSLIKSSGQNIILTAQSDCDKRFENLLSQGYSLQRRAKVGYVEMPENLINSGQYPGVKGFFYKLPVLPTKDIGYPIDEIIEETEGSYQKVLQSKEH